MNVRHSDEMPVRHGGRCLEQPGWSIAFEEEDIQRSSDWRIHGSRHTVIVHLGGRMDGLETELDGHGGSSGPAQPGEVWTVPAGRRYAASARGGLIRYAVISLAPQGMGMWPEKEIGAWDLAARAGLRDDGLHALVRRLGRQLASPGNEASSGILAGSDRLLHYLRRYHVTGPSPPGGRTAPVLAAPTVRRLRRWIQERLAERIRLEDLAMEAGVSAHQLLIGFRQAFGTTPAQYIIRQRLRTARHLLTTTRKDITTIALEAGFSSHSHLTRTFHREAGRPPSRFRMLREGNLTPRPGSVSNGL